MKIRKRLEKRKVRPVWNDLGKLFLCQVVCIIYNQKHVLNQIYPRSEIRIQDPGKCKVSIVIPLHNKADYIGRSLHSAMKQTLNRIEILVIDDGSTDNSVEIVEQLQHEDSRIRLIRSTENQGTHVTRIKGVMACRCDYILSLDPDDLLMPNIAESAVNFAIREKADVVEYQALLNHTNSSEMFDFKEPTFESASGADVLSLFKNREISWNLWKRLVKASVYKAAVDDMLPYTHFKIVYAEDRLHFMAILLHTQKYAYLREIGYIYFRGTPGNSESEADQSMRTCITQLKRVERTIQKILQYYNMTYNRVRAVPDGFRARYDEAVRQRRKRMEQLRSNTL